VLLAGAAGAGLTGPAHIPATSAIHGVTQEQVLTQLPMHCSVPGAHRQKPPVQVSEMPQEFPQQPHFWESVMNKIVSIHLALHDSLPAEQLLARIGGGLLAGVFGEASGQHRPTEANWKSARLIMRC